MGAGAGDGCRARCPANAAASWLLPPLPLAAALVGASATVETLFCTCCWTTASLWTRCFCTCFLFAAACARTAPRMSRMATRGVVTGAGAGPLAAGLPRLVSTTTLVPHECTVIVLGSVRCGSCHWSSAARRACWAAAPSSSLLLSTSLVSARWRLLAEAVSDAAGRGHGGGGATRVVRQGVGWRRGAQDRTRALVRRRCCGLWTGCVIDEWLAVAPHLVAACNKHATTSCCCVRPGWVLALSIRCSTARGACILGDWLPK